MEIQEAEEIGEPLAASFRTVAVAVNGSKRSKRVVQWALKKFVPEGMVHFRLLYVRPEITSVPTAMGNYIPISKVRDDIAFAYKKEVEWQANSMLLTYKHLFAGRKVEVTNVVIEADDVADALSNEIAKLKIKVLVVGASSQTLFSRKGNKLSSKIAGSSPSFCTVYVVSNGKLASIRAAISAVYEMTNDENCSSPAMSFSAGSSIGQSDDVAVNPFIHEVTSPTIQHDQFISNMNDSFDSRSSFDAIDNSSSFFAAASISSSSTSLSNVDFHNRMIGSFSSSFVADSLIVDNIRADLKNSADQIDINLELHKLRIELRHHQDYLDTVDGLQNESFDTSDQLNASHMKAEAKLKEMEHTEEETSELTVQVTRSLEAAEREVEDMEFVRKEIFLRADAEESAAHASCENLRHTMKVLPNVEPFKIYTWEEIKSATSAFSDTLKIGMGAIGSVYKGTFHHTVAAVKILHSNEAHGNKQFKQELDILGRICHPHLLLLIGACPDKGCLVYEYMENGSLDDRLQCKDNTPPLPWFDRFRIAWEVASALTFLHNSKPEPIIHRDLKPANILLDCNFVCKIGDVGLSTLLPTVNFSISTIYKDTAPVGTICYIDPEYQRTGQVSPKSDTYALGIVILQLLTGKPPIGLAYIVELALEDGTLCDILDSKAGEWPEKETQELALLGLSCAEIRRKDRPNLEDQVLPVLERLRKRADECKSLANCPPPTPPSHFICPILQEMMNDPCVASDGYTYDRKAIETWLSMNDKSPMTNLPLSSVNLIPNHSLRSAILEWKSVAK
ncbi:U-box domain-containing protein 52-like [Phalaenopsis equestris]|uniref:U-box domain-containing protein 52-like n=1 Tax=Phalaenopsis equestris TaxID=78828 RepID=UPI0009E3D343|nr:U-box domain-containing protein 52-like [Phalaenopsis equestris]XP_020585005.1 U-box domain-containing protein 52-like [Phalaenopsis equestris]